MRLGCLALGRRVLCEEAAGIEGEGADRREYHLFGLAAPDLQGSLSLLDQAAVEPRQRCQRRLDIDRHACRPQPAKAGDDAERHRVAGRSPGKPRPATVAIAKRFQAGQRRRGFVRRAGGVEEERDPGPSLALVDRLADPRRLGKERPHEVGIFFERAFQRVGAFPLGEDPLDPGIAGGDMPRE